MNTMLAPAGMQWQPCDSALRLREQISVDVQPETHELQVPAGHGTPVRRYGNAIRPRGTPPV